MGSLRRLSGRFVRALGLTWSSLRGLSQAAMPLKTGNLVSQRQALERDSLFEGRFRILDLVGRSERGDTYVVDCPPQAAPFMLKVMDASLVQTPLLRKRFAREAMRTAQVPSGHVLPTLEAGIDHAASRPWFTTPLLRGENLAERVAREGAQPLSEVHALLDALARALGHAHARGIVHYDLTPENVHLGPRRPFAMALRELTVSRFVATAYAARGELVGSVQWMAPEQLDRGRRLAPSANVWSLGLLIFYAAAGRPYWWNASPDREPSRELLREILHAPIATASERARALGVEGSLPPWLDAWFARCVARESTKRFATARAALELVAQMGDDRLLGLAEELDDEERTRVPITCPPARTQTSRSLPPGLVAEVKREGTRRDGRASTTIGLVLVACATILTAFSLGRTGPRREQHPGSMAPPPVPPAADAAASVQLGLPAPAEPTPTRTPDQGLVLLDNEGAPVRPFDLEATLKALGAVHYGTCAVLQPGKILISFAPSGRVSKVSVLRGRFDQTTLGCLAARFGAARTHPFRGEAQSVTAEVAPTR
jgi:serine/threonine protein kinase